MRRETIFLGSFNNAQCLFDSPLYAVECINTLLWILRWIELARGGSPHAEIKNEHIQIIPTALRLHLKNIQRVVTMHLHDFYRTRNSSSSQQKGNVL